MLFELRVNKQEIKITNFYNPQKYKAILDFLLNKFQNRSSLIRRIDFINQVLLSFKKDSIFYSQVRHPKFHYQKKYIVKINGLKDDKKLIKCRNEIKLNNKLIHPNSITTIKQKIKYVIFKLIFNEGRNIQFRGKLDLLGYKFLELKKFSLGKISLGSFKKGDLKLFNKKSFQDLGL